MVTEDKDTLNINSANQHSALNKTLIRVLRRALSIRVSKEHEHAVKKQRKVKKQRALLTMVKKGQGHAVHKQRKTTQQINKNFNPGLTQGSAHQGK